VIIDPFPWQADAGVMRYTFDTCSFQARLYYHDGAQLTFAVIPLERDMKKARSAGRALLAE
jgi:hypothetical protein